MAHVWNPPVHTEEGIDTQSAEGIATGSKPIMPDEAPWLTDSSAENSTVSSTASSSTSSLLPVGGVGESCDVRSADIVSSNVDPEELTEEIDEPNVGCTGALQIEATTPDETEPATAENAPSSEYDTESPEMCEVDPYVKRLSACIC